MGYFPLSIVVLPGEGKELHIFEPRYLQLFSELEGNAGQFAVVPSFNQQAASIGTVCRLRAITQKFENGRCNVIIEGVHLVQISSFEEQLADRLYPGGTIRPYQIPSLTSNNKELIQLIGLLARKLKIELTGFHDSSVDLVKIINQFDLDDLEKLLLIQSRSLNQFEIRLKNFLHLQLNIVNQELKLNNRIMYN